MVQVEVEHKVTQKQMKRMRKRLYCEFVSLHEVPARGRVLGTTIVAPA